MNVSKNAMLGIAIITVLALVFAAWWFFMRSPKMSARDRYHSLGNQGVNQRMTGKNQPYNLDAQPGAGQNDSITNTINQEKSDSVMPAAFPASVRALILGNHFG